MTKTSALLVRLTNDDKRILMRIARARGQSASDFVRLAVRSEIEAIKKSASLKVEVMPIRIVFAPPLRDVDFDIFKICCDTAAQGGAFSYSDSGWWLADLLGGRRGIPKVEDLWAWFREHYPECMALVPARRRHQFLEGVKKELQWTN